MLTAKDLREALDIFIEHEADELVPQATDVGDMSAPLWERTIVCGFPELGSVKPVLRTMPHMLETGVFWYGDNLDVMREHLTSDGEVNLIYLDPPFNSRKAYNSFMVEADATISRAQLTAFEDYWRWGPESQKAYEEIQAPRRRFLVPVTLAETMQMLRRVLGDGNMLAYLSMMAVRLVEMKRLLHRDGSLYLHCDPTSSHYLKLVLDALFTPQCFRNELIWRRSRSHNDDDITKYGAVHDTILFYTNSPDTWFFKPDYQARDQAKPKSHDLYLHTDGKWYRKDNCNPPGGRGPTYTWNGHRRPWRFSPEERDRLIAEGKIVYTRNGIPRVLRPLDPKKGAVRGAPLSDTWVDIDALNSGSDEIVGYPTQKPRALLQRMIEASTKEGDIILDPFCGCGTAVIAAQGLRRKWIGIDITHLAVSVLKRRMDRDFPGVTYRVRGEPAHVKDAQRLAAERPLEFQAWIVDAVGGIPVGAEKEKKVAKAGGDDNRDGLIQFRDDPKAERSKRMVLSVKAGESYVSKPEIVDSLGGAMKRHGAPLGVLLMSHRPSDGTYKRAAGYGTWASETYAPKTRYPVIQIVTVEDIFSPGWRGILLPGENTSGKSQPPPGMPGASEELFDEMGNPKKRAKPAFKKTTVAPASPEQMLIPQAAAGDFHLSAPKRRRRK